MMKTTIRLTTAETVEFLRGHDGYLILTHLRPDGDTLGSASALCLGLRRAGKTAYVLENPETTDKYSFTTAGLYPPEGWKPETVISTDIAAENLVPKCAERYLGRVGLSIDHHPPREPFSERLCEEHARASCGEIIYKILMKLNGEISREEADRLYTAVSTDTGCFVYGNTDAECLRCAADLIDAGADSHELNRRLFRLKSIDRLRLESSIISGIRLMHGGRLAFAVVTKDMVRDENDADDIASIAGQIDGSVASVTLRELKNGRTKISVRSNPNFFDCAEFCAKFGGGGHVAAAGASFDMAIDEAVEFVTRELEAVEL